VHLRGFVLTCQSTYTLNLNYTLNARNLRNSMSYVSRDYDKNDDGK